MSIYLYNLPLLFLIDNKYNNAQNFFLRNLGDILYITFIFYTLIILKTGDMCITPQLEANFGDSAFICVLLHSVTIIMIIRYTINSKAINFSDCFLYYKKLKLFVSKIWVIIKNNLLVCILVVASLVFVLNYFCELILLIRQSFGLTFNKSC